jgi:hypothetical protein
MLAGLRLTLDVFGVIDGYDVFGIMATANVSTALL